MTSYITFYLPECSSTCTRKGCGQEYNPESNAQGSCTFHPGAPIFHEGLKSWSCCADVNKPVLSFDDFLKLPGCAAGIHTDEAPQIEASRPTPGTHKLRMTETTGGKEVYASVRAITTSVPQGNPISAPSPSPASEEEEDLDASVKPGTTCRHKGCGVAFVSDEVSRIGDGEGAICIYHPSPPIFHEGSKGYLCCKRRVLEFEEFMKIEGCKKGRHLFAPKVIKPAGEEMVVCRIDHYQTLTEVHVSIFAKKVNKELSNIQFEESKVFIELFLPDSKKFSRTLDLFGPIDPAASRFLVFGTKVELHLKKSDTRSWIVLEKTNQDLSGLNLTFGVGGRTGTIGGKSLILDETNAAARV